MSLPRPIGKTKISNFYTDRECCFLFLMTLLSKFIACFILYLPKHSHEFEININRCFRLLTGQWKVYMLNNT